MVRLSEPNFTTKPKVNEVAEDKLDKVGPIMNEIGVEAAAIVGGDPNGLFVYGELDDGVVYAAVFKDFGNEVRYFDFSDELAELLRDAWEAEPDRNLRWVAIEYEVNGTSFHVKLRYPEEFKLDEDASDRREAALKRRYGDKPIIYPPISDDFIELRRD